MDGSRRTYKIGDMVLEGKKIYPVVVAQIRAGCTERDRQKKLHTHGSIQRKNDLPSAPTGKKGRPAKHGRRLSIDNDFILSSEKVGGYYTGCRHVLTNIFGSREVMAYVTCTGRENGTKRLFFSTIFPTQLQMFCAWQENAPLNRIGSGWMQYIPLFLYSFRWDIEVSYYEQKSFWSLCAYMVRSRKGIEMLVNLINISYCAMKLLPYMEETLSQYKGCSVQEFRFALSEQIRRQIFYVNMMKNIEIHIKSKLVMKALECFFPFGREIVCGSD